MSAILKFDFQKSKQLRFSEVNYLNYTKKTQFACDNYIFPKTRGNKNKQCTHSTPLKHLLCLLKLTYDQRLYRGLLLIKFLANSVSLVVFSQKVRFKLNRYVKVT